MIKGYKRLEDIGPNHDDMHRQLHLYGMALLDRKFTTAPTLDQLPSRYCAIYESSTTRRIYFNVDGVLTYIELTNA